MFKIPLIRTEIIIKWRPISSLYLSQTEHRPMSQLKFMRDFEASMKKTLETNRVRCAKSVRNSSTSERSNAGTFGSQKLPTKNTVSQLKIDNQKNNSDMDSWLQRKFKNIIVWKILSIFILMWFKPCFNLIRNDFWMCWNHTMFYEWSIII